MSKEYIINTHSSLEFTTIFVTENEDIIWSATFHEHNHYVVFMNNETIAFLKAQAEALYKKLCSSEVYRSEDYLHDLQLLGFTEKEQKHGS